MKLNFKIIFHFFGLLLLFNGGFMLLAALMSFIYKDGVIVHHQEWDIPDFLEIEELEDVYYLTEAYNYIGEIFPVGYYAEYDIHSYLGETLAEAKATKKEMKALLGFDKQ